MRGWLKMADYLSGKSSKPLASIQVQSFNLAMFTCVVTWEGLLTSLECGSLNHEIIWLGLISKSSSTFVAGFHKNRLLITFE